MEAFRQGLQEAGLIKGQDVEIVLRYAQAGLQRLPELAAELVRLKVNVIVSAGDLGPRVAQAATTTIPIVAMSDDVLGAGIVNSLSRPGGMTTGLTILSSELNARTPWDEPKPFIWTKSAGEILKKVARAKQALESQH
jgi:putative tryptophan/tyrosine transport system substrate-binding protein